MIDTNALRDYIYETFRVPASNTTIAPQLLDNVLDHASKLPEKKQREFLGYMFENILRSSEIDQFTI